MTLTRRDFFLFTSAGLLAAGCQKPPPAPLQPVINFRAGLPLALDVARIEVVDRSGDIAPADAPISPAAMARQWAGQRLVAAGSTGTATFVIERAILTAAPISSQRTKFADLIDPRADLDLSAELDASLVVDSPAGRIGGANARASRQRRERVGDDQRKRQLAMLTTVQELADAFDREMTATIRRYIPGALK